MTAPASRASSLPRALPTLRRALQGAPPGPFGLLVCLGGMFVADLAFGLRHDLEPVMAVLVALGTAAVVGVVVVPLLAWTRRASVGAAAMVWLVTAVFVAGGVVRTCLLVLLMPYPSWTSWLRQLAPAVIGALVWFTTSAVLLDWMNRAAVQRMRLDTAYRQLLATRAATSAVLAETEAQLSEVTATTRTAIAEVSDRLHTGITPEELDRCIERVDRLVDREVRPHSHELARMPMEVRSAPVPPLWPTTRVRIVALVRRWPTASPFQADVVAVLSVPVVLAEVATAPEAGRAILALHSLVALLLQLGAVILAAALVTPLLRRMPLRLAIAVTFGIYLALYVLGVWGLVADASRGVETPLAAHVFPSVYALVAGGAAAAAAQHRAESVGAGRVISRIGHDLSRTRQQWWARRRRLSIALHGRVQANLTAAGLLLRRARDEYVANGVLDVALIDQVRTAMRYAWQIDTRSPGTPRDRLVGVTGVWRGIMEVDLTLDAGAGARLCADSDSADACVEVVREVLLNAARHSGATEAAVGISEAGPDLVRIVVRESGDRAPAAPRPGEGLGRSLLDSVTTRWWVRQEGPIRVTTLVLPTDPARAGVGPGEAGRS